MPYYISAYLRHRLKTSLTQIGMPVSAAKEAAQRYIDLEVADYVEVHDVEQRLVCRLRK